MDIRTAILESQKRDKETENIRNACFKGIARQLWVSDSIPGPRLIIMSAFDRNHRNTCVMVPYGIDNKYFRTEWEPSFDDLSADDWFVTTMFRKLDVKN